MFFYFPLGPWRARKVQIELGENKRRNFSQRDRTYFSLSQRGRRKKSSVGRVRAGGYFQTGGTRTHSLCTAVTTLVRRDKRTRRTSSLLADHGIIFLLSLFFSLFTFACRAVQMPVGSLRDSCILRDDAVRRLLKAAAAATAAAAVGSFKHRF